MPLFKSRSKELSKAFKKALNGIRTPLLSSGLPALQRLSSARLAIIKDLSYSPRRNYLQTTRFLKEMRAYKNVKSIPQLSILINIMARYPLPVPEFLSFSFYSALIPLLHGSKQLEL